VCDLRVSRNTVRKGIRSGETEFKYAREVQPRLALARWQTELDELLTTNAARPARERVNLMRIHEQLSALGYTGSYSALRRYAMARDCKAGVANSEVFVPLSFAPGESYQFDWSHDIVVINGVTMTVKVAHVRLSHSRMPFIRAYPRETQEMVFDAHDRAFSFFKGACQRGIRQYENGSGNGLCWPTACLGRRIANDADARGIGGIAPSIAVLHKCAAIIWWSQWPALLHLAGKKVRLRTRLA
jgi:transposase